MIRKWRVRKRHGRWLAVDPDGKKWTALGWSQREAFAFALDHATAAMP